MDAYFSSAISLDFKKEVPRIPENDLAFFGFFPTERSFSAVKISRLIAPSTEIYFNVISNVKIKRSGTRNARSAAVSRFHEVP